MGTGLTYVGRVTMKKRPRNTEEALYEHMQMMRDRMGAAIDQIIAGCPCSKSPQG